MSEETKPGGWWHTLPGVLTAVAGMLTAITGLIVAFSQAGFFKGRGDEVAGASGSVMETPADASLANASLPASRITAKSSGFRIGTIKTQLAAPHTIDAPMPVAMGTTYRFGLDENEATYLRFASPGQVKIILDMQLPQNEHSNLQSRLLLLDEDGATVGNPVINFNEIDVGHRIVTTVTVRRGAAGLKLQNLGKLADLWLTLQPADAGQFVPLFGEIVPQALHVGESKTGSLEKIEYAYYVTSFAPGSYKLILDLSNVDGSRTNIQGYLALLDEDGGGQRKIIRLNEIDTSHRSTETFTLTRPRTMIIQLYNSAHPVNYAMRIVRE